MDWTRQHKIWDGAFSCGLQLLSPCTYMAPQSFNPNLSRSTSTNRLFNVCLLCHAKPFIVQSLEETQIVEKFLHPNNTKLCPTRSISSRSKSEKKEGLLCGACWCVSRPCVWRKRVKRIEKKKNWDWNLKKISGEEIVFFSLVGWSLKKTPHTHSDSNKWRVDKKISDFSLIEVHTRGFFESWKFVQTYIVCLDSDSECRN